MEAVFRTARPATSREADPISIVPSAMKSTVPVGFGPAVDVTTAVRVKFVPTRIDEAEDIREIEVGFWITCVNVVMPDRKFPSPE